MTEIQISHRSVLVLINIQKLCHMIKKILLSGIAYVENNNIKNYLRSATLLEETRDGKSTVSSVIEILINLFGIPLQGSLIQ